MSAAMLDPLPGLLSTITGWPSALPSASLIERATMSAAPPGAKPITRRIGLAGYGAVCARVPAAVSARASAMLNFFIGCLLVCLSLPASGGWHPQHDLADVPARLHARLGLRQLSEVDHLVQLRLD